MPHMQHATRNTQPVLPAPSTAEGSKVEGSKIRIATDARSRASITLDLSRPRAIFVTGKRGSGKTTTLHTIATAVAEQGTTVVAIDPLGALVHLAPDTIPIASSVRTQGRFRPTAIYPTRTGERCRATKPSSPVRLE